MLIRTLGLVLLIAGIASIITITLPSITGTPFTSSITLGPNSIVIGKNGVYLVSSTCTSIPSREAYKTYISISLKEPAYRVGNTPRIKDPALIRLHVYITPPGCTGLGPLPQRVDSFKDLETAIKLSLSTSRLHGQRMIVYHNLPWKTNIDVTSLGGGTRTLILVYYLPADSFSITTLQGQVVSGKQALQQALSSRYIYSTSLQALYKLQIVTKTKLSPLVSWLSFARALSVIVAGILVIAIDAGFHPEYYQGKWRIFRRLAELLGITKS